MSEGKQSEEIKEKTTRGKYLYINRKTGEELRTNMEEEDALERLPADNNFAQDLKRKYQERKGQLSENQLYWIMKLAEEAEEFYPLDTSDIVSILQHGDIKIKFKKLGIDLKLRQNLKIYLNGSRIGRYTNEGVYLQGSVDPKIFNQFISIFAKDGATNCFDRIGKATGICCYCGRELTHEISKRLGRGPVCSDKYGLPFPHEEYQASIK